MNDIITDSLDQTDEGILTHEVADEALEAAAGADERLHIAYTSPTYYPPKTPCC